MTGLIEAQEAILVGKIKSEIGLSGKLHTADRLIGHVSISIGYEEYDGVYNVVPKNFSQTLNTYDKHMNQDVILQAIPYYEVDNEQSGQTVIIGG